jgi:hypothetical protein
MKSRMNFDSNNNQSLNNSQGFKMDMNADDGGNMMMKNFGSGNLADYR